MENLSKLSDEKLIYDTFKDDEHWRIRVAVINKLSDKKLISYFKDDKDEDIRLYVKNK